MNCFPTSVDMVNAAGKVQWTYTLTGNVEQVQGPYWNGRDIVLLAETGNPGAKPNYRFVLSPSGTVSAHLSSAGSLEMMGNDELLAFIAPPGATTTRYEAVAPNGSAVWSITAPSMEVVATSGNKALVAYGVQGTAALSLATGKVLWTLAPTKLHGVQSASMAFVGPYVVEESIVTGKTRPIAIVDAWSGVTSQLLWQREYGSWDTTGDDQGWGLHLVAGRDAFYGCVSPGALGKTRGRPVCYAYSPATGKAVQTIPVPHVQRGSSVVPLAVSDSNLFLGVVSGATTETMAVPLKGRGPVYTQAGSESTASTFDTVTGGVTVIDGGGAWLWSRRP